jgi:hypothetical protein
MKSEQPAEVHQTFPERCRSGASNSFVYFSFCVTWSLECFLLWKLRQIKENLKLATELRISVASSILNGLLGAIGAFTGSYILLLLTGILFVMMETYASSILPIQMSERPRNQNANNETSHIMSASSRASADEVKNYQKYILQDLQNDLKLYEQFKTALSREFAIENILFLESVSEMENEEKQTFDHIEQITRKFIASGSEYEINITSEMRASIQLLSGGRSADHLEEIIDLLMKVAKETMKELKFGALARFKRQLSGSKEEKYEVVQAATSANTSVSSFP